LPWGNLWKGGDKGEGYRGLNTGDIREKNAGKVHNVNKEGSLKGLGF